MARVRTLAAVGILGAALALPAIAQDAPPAEATQPKAPPALAAPAENDQGVEEIVVTITKRAESVQDIAGSIVGFSPQTIEDANIENLGDMVSMLPNVQVKSEETDISVRGVARAAFDSLSPIAQHLNGVYMFNGLAYVGQFYDLEGIDVALGPSGTLYGRNATGGAIDLKWHRPTDSSEVFGDVTYSPRYDGYQVRGGVNIPLLGEGNDKLLARFVMTREAGDSTTKNLEGNDRQGFGAADLWTFRAQLAARPSDNLDMSLRVSYVKGKSRYAGGVQLDQSRAPAGTLSLGSSLCGPTGVCPFDWANGFTAFKSTLLDPANFTIIGTITRNDSCIRPDGMPVARCVPAISNTTGLPFTSRNEAVEDILLFGRDLNGNGIINPAERDIPPLVRSADFFTPAKPFSGSQNSVRSRLQALGTGFLEVWGVDGTINYALEGVPLFGDIDLTLLGGVHELRDQGLSDSDGTELGALDTLSSRLPDKWKTFEMRAQSHNDSWLNWSLGFFFVDDRIKQHRATLTPLFVSGANLTQHETGYAPFASIFLTPIDPIEITLGVRWNHDTFQRHEQPLPSPFDFAPVALDASKVFREITLDAQIKWKITEDHMVYAKWSRGYKSGFVQRVPASATSAAETLFINPEAISATEIGFKTAWLDKRVNLNGAAFYYDYTNLQVPVIRQTQIVNSNADKAEVWGVEAVLDTQLVDDLSIRFAVGWLKAEFVEFCVSDPLVDLQLNPPAPDPFCVAKRNAAPPEKRLQIGNQNVVGNRLEDSPEWKVSTVAHYRWDLGNLGTLSPTLEFTWTADAFRRPFNTPSVDLSPAYTKTDARLRWSEPENRYWVEAFGENLENNYVYPRGIAVAITGTAQGFGLLQPRTYGVRLGFEWGGK